MRLEIYTRDDGLFAWRLKAANGRIVATDGGQGYVNKAECRAMAVAITTGVSGSRGINGPLEVIEL
jgi:uncharacterized protein YegP (UPF0339 family)